MEIVMNRKICSLVAILSVVGLVSCSEATSNNSSNSDLSSLTSSVFDSSSESDLSTDGEADEPYIDYYVSSVSDTSASLISGLYNGVELDYVISSYPVILAARNSSGKDLTEIINVAEEFGEKYGTEGFPQAGLFIKTDLDENNDADTITAIKNFLGTFDNDVVDIINGATNAVAFMNEYSNDSTTQQARFGFASSVLTSSQAENKLAFISADDNPSLEELSVFEDPLNLTYSENQLSSYYPTNYTGDSQYEIVEELNFTITCPQGAPAATLARYATSENANIVASTQVSAAFATGESDFIIFDSVNGLNLAEMYCNNYKLVRMVTFGNLYVVATGNDDNGQLDRTDIVLSYGQDNVPDLAFKAVYGA